MRTAKNKTGHGAAWANLIVCGGISWAVSLWHAFHPEQGTHPNTALALLIATAPIVTAAFGSHNIAKRGGGKVRVTMTALVFAMGMALSIKAQAQSVGPFVGGTPLGVVFALMLDLSTFIALSSIMSGEPVEASAEMSGERPLGVRLDASRASAGTSADASPGRVPERLPDVAQTPSETSARTRPQTPVKAAKKTPKKRGEPKLSTRQQVRQILIETPEMSAADVARKLGRTPSGHMRTMCAELLSELIESGTIDAPPLRIAQ